MLKVKSGELDKLGLLYERYKKRLFGFFFNMNGSAAVSEDLVQNVFERILKYRHTFTGEGPFVAWMFRTARNVNYDYHRKTKQVYTDIDTVANKIQDPEALIEQISTVESVSQLQQALVELPYEKREILVLSKFKSLKYSEIGELLGCSEGTAKVKAHRALKDLRTIYLRLEKK